MNTSRHQSIEHMGDAAKARRRRSGRSLLVTAVLAAALVTVSATVPTPAGANETFQFTRLAGNDRYETANIVAKAFAANTDNAVVATGETFPDALAGNYLAGALTAPIVLTQRDQLPAPSAAALADLKVVNVTLLGGTAAVSDAVETDLKAKGYKVERVAGTDRYDTARVLAEKPGAEAVGSEGAKKTAILASGENFPDAIAAGPLSYAGRFPTLLTNADHLAPAAKSGLSTLGIQQVLLLGGTAAISPTVEAELTAAGMSVVRLAGVDRSDTAAKIADFAVSKLGFTNTRVTLARGTAFPDALAGAPKGGKDKTATLLAAAPDALGAATEAWLKANAGTLIGGDILGGLNAISRETQAAAEAAAGKLGDEPVLTITEGPVDNGVAAGDKPTYKGTATDEVGVDGVEVKVDAGEFGTTDLTCEGCDTPSATWAYTPTTALTAGKHTFAFRAVDAGGLRSTEVVRTVNIDASKPTLESLGANGGNSTVTAFFSEQLDCTTVQAADFQVQFPNSVPIIKSVECTAPGDSTIGLALSSYPNTGDSVSIKLQGEVKDLAGNVADLLTVTGTAASGPPPVVTVTEGASPAEGARTNDQNPDYSGIATDDTKVTKIESRIDHDKDATDAHHQWTTHSLVCTGCANGGAAKATWTFVASSTTNTAANTALSAGTHTIEFRATDDSGSLSNNIVTRHVFIDLTPPQFATPALVAQSKTSTVKAIFDEPLNCSSVADDGGTDKVAQDDFTVSVNDGVPRNVLKVVCATTTATLTLDPPLLPAGAIVTVTLKTGSEVKDEAGNKAIAPVSKSVTLAADPSFDSVVAKVGEKIVQAKFNTPINCASVDTTGPSFDDFTAKIDTSDVTIENTACSGTSSATVLLTLAEAPASGAKVYVTLVGPVTDMNGTTVAPVIRDTTAAANGGPTLTVTGSPNGSTTYTNVAVPQYSGTASDPDGQVTKVEYQLQGAASWTAATCSGCGTTSATWSFSTATAEGTHSYSIRATDDNLVVSAPYAVTVVVDRTAPTFTNVTQTALTADITVFFSEPISCGSVATGDFSVTVDQLSASVIAETCSVDAASFTLTLSQTPLTDTSVSVTIAANNLLDRAGNGNTAGTQS
jgi:putative cell wall-binding protein